MIKTQIKTSRLQKGVTLPEMLVAVAITVSMLLITGSVFKHTTDAAGKAIAHNELMQQLRAFTHQLDTDFSAIDDHMPLIIIFETYDSGGNSVPPNPALGDPPDDPSDPSDPDLNRMVRYDRILFFATDEFEVPNPQSADSISAPSAIIYYGQSADTYPYPGDPDNQIDPPRKVLTRREKLIVIDRGNWLYPTGAAWASDYYPFELSQMFGIPATLAYWQQIGSGTWESCLGDVPMLGGLTPEGLSLILRPGIERLYDEIMKSQKQPKSEDKFSMAGLQRLFLLPDVTDLQIQFWTGSAWFPEPTEDIILAGGATSWEKNAYFWNIDGPTIATGGTNDAIWHKASPTYQFPTAFRFTFTLYDRNRRHYPEGKTFSYIVRPR